MNVSETSPRPVAPSSPIELRVDKHAKDEALSLAINRHDVLFAAIQNQLESYIVPSRYFKMLASEKNPGDGGLGIDEDDETYEYRDEFMLSQDELKRANDIIFQFSNLVLHINCERARNETEDEDDDSMDDHSVDSIVVTKQRRARACSNSSGHCSI
jgi:hypothetical protein